MKVHALTFYFTLKLVQCGLVLNPLDYFYKAANITTDNYNYLETHLGANASKKDGFIHSYEFSSHFLRKCVCIEMKYKQPYNRNTKCTSAWM